VQTSDLLVAIDEEIDRLQQVRNLLAGNSSGLVKRAPKAASIAATAFPFGMSKSTAPKKRRTLSAAGRARIAAAQKARWAKLKKTTGEKEKNGKK
jgi:hypothetical protein